MTGLPVKKPCTSYSVNGQSCSLIISLIRLFVEFFIEKQRKAIILLINVDTKTILYTMSDLLDKLNNLEQNLELLSKKIDSTSLENSLLKNQQTKLVSEKSD